MSGLHLTSLPFLLLLAVLAGVVLAEEGLDGLLDEVDEANGAGAMSLAVGLFITQIYLLLVV